MRKDVDVRSVPVSSAVERRSCNSLLLNLVVPFISAAAQMSALVAADGGC